MASIKAQGKSRAKARKDKKRLELDPLFSPLYQTELSALNPPQASTSQLPPVMAAPTQAELAQMVLDLGVALGNLATQITTLTTATTTNANMSSRSQKVAVARPKAWNGKGGSVEE